MVRRIVSVLAALPFFALIGSPVAVAADPVYTPAPIAVPAGKSLEQVKNAIRKACFDKGWQMREVGSGHIEAKHTKKTHVAVVDIKYNSKDVRLSYKDSEDLDYDKENGTIHRTFNRWMRYLEKNVRANLGSY